MENVSEKSVLSSPSSRGVVCFDRASFKKGIAEFCKLTAAESRDNGEDVFTRLLYILYVEVPSHFRYEELHYFPSILLRWPTSQTVQLIAQLRSEHRALLQEAENLYDRLIDYTYNHQDCPRDLWVSGGHFFDDLDKHLAREDEWFRDVGK